MSRCLIVNLWGITGVGKTALVRSLVQKLDFGNRFVEVSMDGISNGGDRWGGATTICSILQGSSIEEGKPGIVFLDEFQRFKTVNSDGSDVKLERYQDVWMLLSDGHFSSDYSFINRIERELANMEYYEDMQLAHEAEAEAEKENKARKEKVEKADQVAKDQTSAMLGLNSGSAGAAPVAKKDEEIMTVKPKYKRKFTLYPYEAETLKKLLRLSESVTEIMKWTKDRIRALVKEYAATHQNAAIDYTKCLIFVSGNLDEAFRISNNVEDCDTSAEVYYEWTRKVSVIQIKKALTQRFRPEQIARLGNNHVIYPSLNKEAYMSIIRRSCGDYLREARKVCSIQFEVKETVYTEIYENSVYPAQGTRPVFTSIHKLFGSPLADAMLWGLELGAHKMVIDLDGPASSLVFTVPETEHRKVLHIDFELRARRKDRSPDFEALVAVHEAGHAIVYAELFRLPPVEIAINVASFKGGYNLFDELFESRTDCLNRMAVSMAGIVAEEMVFGPELRSTGSVSDIEKATKYAGHYVRREGMDGTLATIMITPDCLNIHNLDASDLVIENLVKTQKDYATTVLTKHRALLIGLSRELIKSKKMDAKAFIEFSDDAFKGLSSKRPVDVIGDYAKRLELSCT